MIRLRFAYGQVTLGQVSNNGMRMRPKLIITRPAPDGARFAAQFDAHRVILSPLQRIDPVDATCDARAVIFTSTNGVAQAARLGMSSGPAWCVGARTAHMAQAAGFDAQSADGNVEDLLRLIIAAKPDMPMAHIRGCDARGDLAPRLRAAGFDCADCIAYMQTPVPLSADAIAAIDGAEPVIIPLFSPRAAQLLSDQVTIGPHITVIAISKAVATNLDAANIITAPQPNGDAMLLATKQVLAML